MISLILRTATHFLFTIMLQFSLFLLLRGHNEPGGGFVAGLMAAGGFALYTIAYDVAATRQALRVDPRTLIAVGLAIAAGSGLLSLMKGSPFMTGEWGHLRLPYLERLNIGTPLLFDTGVYLTVIGVTLMIILSLAEE